MSERRDNKDNGDESGILKRLKDSSRGSAKGSTNPLDYMDLIPNSEPASDKKIFGIGQNKTGTTSLAVAMAEFGYVVGDTIVGLLHFNDYQNNDFERLIKFCNSGDFFQDIPFSLPGTYRVMDETFPDSKFILTVRKDSRTWYDSVINYHAKIAGVEKGPINSEQLKSISLPYPGFFYDVHTMLHRLPDDNLYDYNTLVRDYENYNGLILEYFKDRPEDLLVLDVAKEDALLQLAKFLGEPIPEGMSSFPHVHKTRPV